MLNRLKLAALSFTLALAGAHGAAQAGESARLRIVGGIAGADGAWDYASIDADARRLYVARGDGVMAVDLGAQAVTPVLVAGQRVHGVAPLPDGLAASTNGESGAVTLFRTSDGGVVAQLPAGKKPDAVVRDPKSGLVVVMNGGDGSATLIDADKKVVAGSIAVGGVLEFAAAAGDGRVFVNVEDRNELVELDIPGRAVVRRLALKGCDSPTGLALDSRARVLVSACGNGVALAVSAVDGALLATLPIGKGPDAVLFDEKNRQFMIPCGRDGVLTVIGAQPDGSLKVIETAPTARGARTGAIDQSTGKVYLPVAEFEPGKAGERPVAKPGTFRILVLDRS
jgi:DNA-binding beta-propeller fold protein YncE